MCLRSLRMFSPYLAYILKFEFVIFFKCLVKRSYVIDKSGMSDAIVLVLNNFILFHFYHFKLSAILTIFKNNSRAIFHNLSYFRICLNFLLPTHNTFPIGMNRKVGLNKVVARVNLIEFRLNQVL